MMYLCPSKIVFILANSADPDEMQPFGSLLFAKVPGPKVIKLFLCSTQLSMKIILLINVEMPTIFGFLTLISMINRTFERRKARNFFIFGILVFMSS